MVSRALQQNKPKRPIVSVAELPLPRQLLPFIALGDDLRSITSRVLNLTRLVLGMRQDEVNSMIRSSIKRVTLSNASPAWRVVQFRTAKSKAITRHHFAYDANYLECITVSDSSTMHCTDPALASFCPACELLKLKQMVDDIPAAAAHDHVFVNSLYPNKQLATSTVAAKATEILNKWTAAAPGRKAYTSHALREIAVNTLNAKGVPEREIQARGTIGGASDVLRLIYSSRVVPTNFSNKILKN